LEHQGVAGGNERAFKPVSINKPWNCEQMYLKINRLLNLAGRGKNKSQYGLSTAGNAV
jgi:hypothetical protein